MTRVPAWRFARVIDHGLRALGTAALLLGLLGAGPGASEAHAPEAPGPRPSHSQAETLTQGLVSLNVRYQLGGPAEKAQLLGQLVSVAASRQQVLMRLVETDPGEVLRVAVPDALRAGLPLAARKFVEEEVDIEGTLEVLHEDRDAGSRYLYFLETVVDRLSLHFAADPPALQTGTRVRVRGVRVDGALALKGGGSVQAVSAVLPNTFGEQRTIVILVNFQNKPTEQPYTPAHAWNVVFDTTSSFFLENSHGQTWLTGDVSGWHTIALDSTVCDSSKIATLAKQAAAAAGVNLSAYRRHMYAFPKNACTWWGLGSVGGNPSQAWINGSFQLRVVGHELGHNFGLYHSRSLDCGTVTLGPSCTIGEYGDTLDIMGSSSGHFNAFQKERIGWLGYGASPPLTPVSADGSYWVDAYESLGSAPKGLKILKSTDPGTGKKTWYYVEYRRAIGFDSFLSGNTNVLNGVVVHTGSESSGNSSNLLDMTPLTASWNDPALVFGWGFYDPDSGVNIAPVSPSGSAALVNVTFGPLACVPAAPTVTLAPSQSQWVTAGTTVTYTTSVTNNDNAGCAPSTFALVASVPAGWAAALGQPALSLAPGTTASTPFQVTSAVPSPDGFYTVGVSASDGATPGHAASASGTYVVVASLDVAAATSQPSYSRPSQVSVTATVTANGAPVSGALVSFTVTKANGAVLNGNATTGSGGSATYKFQLKKQDPAGTYAVTSTATLNGALSGSVSTSFTVQ